MKPLLMEEGSRWRDNMLETTSIEKMYVILTEGNILPVHKNYANDFFISLIIS